MRGDASVDRRLQVSRRIDWRFLLPSPKLGDVAYAGRGEGELVAALESFSDRLTRLPAAAPDTGDFELVVVERPGPDVLEQALDRVRPGGHLYVEAGPAALCGSRAARHARLLESRGFREVRVHWHWPSFGSPTALLDARSPGSLGFFLEQRRPGVIGRVLKRCLGTLASRGILERWVSSASVLARRERP